MAHDTPVKFLCIFVKAGESSSSHPTQALVKLQGSVGLLPPLIPVGQGTHHSNPQHPPGFRWAAASLGKTLPSCSMEMTGGTRGLCAGSTLLSRTKLGAGGFKGSRCREGAPPSSPSPGTAFVSPWPDSSTPLPELAGASSACNPCGFYLRARARGGEKGGQPSALKEPGKNNRLQLGDRYAMALKKHTAPRRV